MSEIAETQESGGKVAEIPRQRSDGPGRLQALVPADMSQAMQLAEMMSRGKLVPEHLQDAPADCLLVIEQSMRWHMSPFAVGQATSSIRGKLMFEGKLVAAAVNNSGILSGRLNCEYSGEGHNLQIRVFATIRGEQKERSVDVKLADVATNNDIWKKQPEQQLFYAGARIWARRHAPEVMLGVYTPEEFADEPPRATQEPQYRGRAELATYPEDKFEENLPKWQAKIRAGTLSADEVIAKVESKGALTDDQKRRIRKSAATTTEQENQ